MAELEAIAVLRGLVRTHLAEASAAEPGSNDEQFARVVGLILDGLLPVPGAT